MKKCVLISLTLSVLMLFLSGCSSDTLSVLRLFLNGCSSDKNTAIPKDTTAAKTENVTVSEIEKDEFDKSFTNLEFWICENVDNVDFSKYQEKTGIMGGREYYGTEYVPTFDEHRQTIDPEHSVVYTVTSYPDYSDEEKHITGIYITDPDIEFYGIKLGMSYDEFEVLIEKQGFEVTEVQETFCKAEKDNVWISFTEDCIRIRAEVENKSGIVF